MEERYVAAPGEASGSPAEPGEAKDSPATPGREAEGGTAAPDRGASDGGAGVKADAPKRIAVICVGNKLMLDEGIGPAVYEELTSRYVIPEQVQLFDAGCMSLDMLPLVRDCDTIITVDAVDSTGEEPGTVFRFSPDAMARHSGAMASLHDLKLVDLFDAAALLGYEAEGLCLGMQVENMSPAEYTIGLTPKVDAQLPLLVETVVAELYRRGAVLEEK